MTQDLIETLVSGPLKKRDAAELTPRQREVLQLLVEGCSMKEAARILGVTPRTVAFHKYRMMDQFRLKSNAELTRRRRQDLKRLPFRLKRKGDSFFLGDVIQDAGTSRSNWPRLPCRKTHSGKS